jgi:uncharacterized protein YacL
MADDILAHGNLPAVLPSNDGASRRVQVLAAFAGLAFAAGGIFLHVSHTKIETNNLVLIGIGLIIVLIPWIHSFQLGADGMQLTMARTKDATTAIAENLQKTSAEKKNVVEALQAQINKLTASSAHADGENIPQTNEQQTVSVGAELFDAVTRATGAIAKLL